MPLVYFISGMVFSTLLHPLIEEVGDCIISQMEVWKAKSAETINEINIRIQKTAEEDTPPVRQIGFAVSDISEKETEEEYDDEE